VKKRREQREAEKAAMAEELEMIQRERAIAEAVDLEKKEEEVSRGAQTQMVGACSQIRRTSRLAAKGRSPELVSLVR
jgi:hypothetical protein